MAGDAKGCDPLREFVLEQVGVEDGPDTSVLVDLAVGAVREALAALKAAAAAVQGAGGDEE